MAKDIAFTCHQCGQHLAIAGEGAGLTVQCPGCNSGLSVPAASDLPVTVSPDFGPLETATKLPTATCNLESFFYSKEDLGFWGNCRRSLNGQYAIAWGSTQPGRGGGIYDNVYLLLRDEVVVLKDRRDHIMSAVVAENGAFLLWNCSKSGSDVITLFDETGTRQKQMRFRCIYPPTFDLQNGFAILEIPADWAKIPSGSLTFNLLDGTHKVEKPINRQPY